MKWSASRNEWIVAVACASMIVALAWTVERVRAKQTAAGEAESAHEDCTEFANRIAATRQAPQRAVAYAQSEADVTSRIEAAARAAGLPANAITLIDPRPLERVAETSYRRQTTQLEFNPLLLPKLIAFLKAVSTGDPPLTVTDVRLSAASAGDGAEVWLAEVSLTQVVYDPITPVPL